MKDSDADFLNASLAGISFEELWVRLLVATAVGIILGIDRELRGIPAGIRTHGLVALSSAAITVSALILDAQLSGGGHGATDPLRVIQGLAQAIGFIAAGVIFVSRGKVRNVTSAANVWLATAVGIAAGAGQYALVLVATVLGVVLVTVVGFVERFLPGADKREE